MSADPAQQYALAHAPQRKPTDASDHLLAGARYGLRPAHAGDVSDEPASFARMEGRFERLTVSPQSTLGPSSSDRFGAPPPLPSEHMNPRSRYTTSRTGSASNAPPPQMVHHTQQAQYVRQTEKHRVLAPMDQRPPSPPRQRRVPPSLASSSPATSRAASPLTPPLTPRAGNSPQRAQQGSQFPVAQPYRQSRGSGSRPLPHIPQQHAGTSTQSPRTHTECSRFPPVQPHKHDEPVGRSHPEFSRPRSIPSAQHSPARAATADMHQAAVRPHAPQMPSHAQPSRAAAVDAQQPARTHFTLPTARRDAPGAAPIAAEPARSGAAQTVQTPAPARAATADLRAVPSPAGHPPPRAVTLATDRQPRQPTPEATGQPSSHTSHASQLPMRAPTTDVEVRPSGPSAATRATLESAQAAQSGPPVPPKTPTPSGPAVPAKQASSASAPAQASAAASTPSGPPKAATPTPSASLPAAPRRDRPKAQPKDKVKVEGKASITHTSYLDPCLSKSLLTVPAAMTTTADAALSAVEAYPEQDFNWTIGAPIGGLGGLAKHYVLRPDAKFQTENGGISLTLGVVDERGGGRPSPSPSPAPTSGPDGAAPPKPERGPRQGRTKARVEVRSDKGGILVDVRELDANRQLDLLVETRKGDVLVLLPEAFLGPVHVRGDEPVFGSVLRPQLDAVVNPYEGLWTTNVVPLGAERGAGRSGKNKFRAHKLMKGISKYVPDALREQDDYLDMAVSSYTTLRKGDQSKVLIKAENGKVCVGLGGSKDAKDLRENEDIKVGADEGTKKHWWS